MKIGKIAILAIIVPAAVIFAAAAYSGWGGLEPSKNMGNYCSFSYYSNIPGNAAVNWMQPGIGPGNPADEFWFDSSGNFNVPSGVNVPGTMAAGSGNIGGQFNLGNNCVTVNNLSQLAANANFAGTVYLTGPVTLTSNLTLTCDLRPIKGAIITRGTYTLTLNTCEAGNYQIFNPSDTGMLQFTSSAEIPPQWFGAKGNNSADDTAAFAAWGTAIQTPLLSGQIDYPMGIIPGGDYQMNTMPTITVPVKICTRGTVTFYTQQTGVVFWSFQNASSANVGPVVEGPIWIHTQRSPSIVFQWAGTAGGDVRDIHIVDTAGTYPGAVGIEIRNGISNGLGCYANVFTNVTATSFGTNWRLMTYVSVGRAVCLVTHLSIADLTIPFCPVQPSGPPALPFRLATSPLQKPILTESFTNVLLQGQPAVQNQPGRTLPN